MAKGCGSSVDADAMPLVENMSLLHYLIDGPQVAVLSYVLAHVPFPVPVEEASVLEGAPVQEGEALVFENDIPEEVQSVQ